MDGKSTASVPLGGGGGLAAEIAALTGRYGRDDVLRALSGVIAAGGDGEAKECKIGSVVGGEALREMRAPAARAVRAAPVGPDLWSGFYKKTLGERHDLLRMVYPALFPAGGAQAPAEERGVLPATSADLMVENCIGTISIPLGLGLNFVINGRSYAVPMAVEEPSVIAAASSAAKLVGRAGGFMTSSTENVMTAQVQLLDVADPEAALERVASHRQQLVEKANTFCASMKARGGGAVDIWARIVEQDTGVAPAATHLAQATADARVVAGKDADADVPVAPHRLPRGRMVIVHIEVNVCEAMGANIVNTVAEGVAPTLVKLVGGACRAGLRILTNLCMNRRARARFAIPLKYLAWKGLDGRQVAERVVEASNFGHSDPYRASTNNKGIMNGIDAVAVATGQDWRAIESAAHASAACLNGRYSALSFYSIKQRVVPESVNESGVEPYLEGIIELPMAVGTKGGALPTHPGYRYTHALLGNPTARELSELMVAVGLAQNFAALRALAVEGIQKGHMALHARNIASAAGAPSTLVPEVSEYMRSRGKIDAECAKESLQAHEFHNTLKRICSGKGPLDGLAAAAPSMAGGRKGGHSAGGVAGAPSTFYVSLTIPSLEGGSPHDLSINLAFETFGLEPVHLVIREPAAPGAKGPAQPTPAVQQALLGDKDYDNLLHMFNILDVIKCAARPALSEGAPEVHDRQNIMLQVKLKLLSILLNIVSYRLMAFQPDVTRDFLLRAIKAHAQPRGLPQGPQGNDGRMSMGISTEVRQELLQSVTRQLRTFTADGRAGGRGAAGVELVGFPLVLTLWQTFDYHVQQFIDHPVLSAAFSREQRLILDTIANQRVLPPSCGPIMGERDSTQWLLGYLSQNAKRWQATMSMLCDTLAVSPKMMSESNLRATNLMGQYMEWVGMIAHDVSTWRRDVEQGGPNALVEWTRARTGGADSKLTTAELMGAVESYVDEFVSTTDGHLEGMKADILKAQGEVDDTMDTLMFDMDAWFKTVDVIHGHYAGRARAESY